MMERKALDSLIEIIEQAQEDAQWLGERTARLDTLLKAQDLSPFDFQSYRERLDTYSRRVEHIQKTVSEAGADTPSTLTKAKETAARLIQDQENEKYLDAILMAQAFIPGTEEAFEQIQKEVRAFKEKKNRTDEKKISVYRTIGEILLLEEDSMLVQKLLSINTEIPSSLAIGLAARSYRLPQTRPMKEEAESAASDSEMNNETEKERVAASAGESPAEEGDKETGEPSLSGEKPQPGSPASILVDENIGYAKTKPAEPAQKEEITDEAEASSASPSGDMDLRRLLETILDAEGDTKALEKNFDEKIGYPVFTNLHEKNDGITVLEESSKQAAKPVKVKEFITLLKNSRSRGMVCRTIATMDLLYNDLGFIWEEDPERKDGIPKDIPAALARLYNKGYIRKIWMPGYEASPAAILTGRGAKLLESGNLKQTMKTILKDYNVPFSAKRDADINSMFKGPRAAARSAENPVERGDYLVHLVRSRILYQPALRPIFEKEDYKESFVHNIHSIRMDREDGQAGILFIGLFTGNAKDIRKFFIKSKLPEGIDEKTQILVFGTTEQEAESAVRLLQVYFGADLGRWYMVDPDLSKAVPYGTDQSLGIEDLDLVQTFESHRKEAEEASLSEEEREEKTEEAKSSEKEKHPDSDDCSGRKEEAVPAEADFLAKAGSSGTSLANDDSQTEPEGLNEQSERTEKETSPQVETPEAASESEGKMSPDDQTEIPEHPVSDDDVTVSDNSDSQTAQNEAKKRAEEEVQAASDKKAEDDEEEDELNNSFHSVSESVELEGQENRVKHTLEEPAEVSNGVNSEGVSADGEKTADLERASRPEEEILIDQPEFKDEVKAQEQHPNEGGTSIGKEERTETRINLARAEELYEKAFEMLTQERYHEASAMFYALAQERTEEKFERTAFQAGYALDDPLREIEYDENYMLELFSREQDPGSEWFLASAVLRMYFYDNQKRHFSLSPLYALYAETSLNERFPALRSLMYELANFKESNDRYGLDRFASYHHMEINMSEAQLTSLRKQASYCYRHYVEEHNFSELGTSEGVLAYYAYIFAMDMDIPCFLRAVRDNDTKDLETISAIVADLWIENKAEIRSDHVDQKKISRYIDSGWDTMRVRRENRKRRIGVSLVNPVRKTVVKTLTQIASLTADWIYFSNKGKAKKESRDYAVYTAECAKIQRMSAEALAELAPHNQIVDAGGCQVLRSTLSEIVRKLEGTCLEDEKKFYYFPFVRQDWVLLNEDFVPYLKEPYYLPDLLVSERILKNYENRGVENTAWADRVQELFLPSSSCFGTVDRIEEYYQLHLEKFADEDMTLLQYKADNVSKASYELERNWEDFVSELELSRAYGKLDQTIVDQKELFTTEGERWKQFAKETSNYGFFEKIAEGFKKQIQHFSRKRAEELKHNLTEYLQEQTPEQAEEEKAAVEMIRSRLDDPACNYTAVEDMLNRLQSHHTASFFAEKENTLEKFLNDYSYLYQLIHSATPRRPFTNVLPSGLYNKELRAGMRLLSLWPRSGSSGNLRTEDLQELLSVLGFESPKIQAYPEEKNMFKVLLENDRNGTDTYQTPISVFQSKARTKGFDLIVLFGRCEVDNLMMLSRQLRNPSIIILDYRLKLSERRTLARKSKEDYAGKTFIVIDQVVAAFLARNYDLFQVNRALMEITLPFAFYQPYVQKATEPTPPEMFIGREEELASVIDPGGANIIYGGRQLGKSALLMMARNKMHHPEKGEYAVLVVIKSLQTSEACVRIAREISLQTGLIGEEEIHQIDGDWDTLNYVLKKKLNDSDIQNFLLLIDEADKLLESSADNKYAPISALKELETSSMGRFKFVIAGLRNVVRFSRENSLSGNSPLPHLSSITITPFGYDDGKKLLTQPLSTLGFRFRDDEETEMLIATILAETNYFPGMIQLYGYKFVESMKRGYAGFSEGVTPPYLVSEKQLREVLKDDTLTEKIREMFTITLSDDTDNYYLILANLIASLYHDTESPEGSSPAEIAELAELLEIPKIASLSLPQLDALLQEMCELNILKQTASGLYRFSRNNFLQMMGTKYDIDSTLERMMED
ncbi:hypothetical protein [uncultured Allobaculum sp.]|uniref:hypothetical protein n=1 Tax=uncultured Allobaculum sp. TaxID=1187017 RepID=UPI0025848620|nr:hypothetical protein [uncultured Allobaculum sp.]